MKNILVVATGGTIASVEGEGGGLAPLLGGEELVRYVPETEGLCRIDVVQPMNIDSTNMRPADWMRICDEIVHTYDAYDGFVVLHGTDTMSYTASALSFLLENLAKPVVFTGSQIPIGVLRTDGRENLMTAIEIASARIDGRPAVPEVSLYFQNCLFRANRTTKRSSEDLSAFWSYNYPALADVGSISPTTPNTFSSRSATTNPCTSPPA